ncbi:hypothetical protein O181_004415 [Austropuccinia psidii MF-1]|uniref:Uncharacterized protein n=1 Tax=Austropuccinia psidii MF-1 TaxID=1389203 RepID=A0A9Q3BGX5_9BASI|nr:hypothetical protein [Austropuccinia psidii MF-1]
MRPKGAKGEAHHPPIPDGCQTASGPNWAKFWPTSSRTHKPQIGHTWPQTPIFHPWPLATTRGQQDVPSSKGKPFTSVIDHALQGQGMGIYSIIYHYAPFFLRNPMVKLSRINSVI